VRELDERVGLEAMVAAHLSDSRHGLSTSSGCPISCCNRSTWRGGYEDPNDAARLSTEAAGDSVITDNLSSTHKTQAMRTFLLDHPHVHLPFTPTYPPWPNQAELWFAKIERDLLARGIFTSVADLARKIRRYIRHYNKAPKPIRWNYRNPAHRISSTSVSTVH
jgi:transposase